MTNQQMFSKTTRLSLICAASTGAGFPDDAPPPPAALAKLVPLSVAKGTVCLSSPLCRARDTATALGLRATIDPALAETDYGAWAGIDPARIAELHPQDFALWLSDPVAAPHGGESFADMAARMAAWLDAQAGTRAHIVALTHPGPIQAAVIHVLGATLHAARAIGVKPLSRTRLSHDGRRWSLQLGI